MDRRNYRFYFENYIVSICDWNFTIFSISHLIVVLRKFYFFYYSGTNDAFTTYYNNQPTYSIWNDFEEGTFSIPAAPSRPDTPPPVTPPKKDTPKESSSSASTPVASSQSYSTSQAADPSVTYINSEKSLKEFLANQYNPNNAGNTVIIYGLKDVFSHVPLYLTAVGSVFKFDDTKGNYVLIRKTDKDVIVHAKNTVHIPLNVLDTSYDSYTIYFPTLTHGDIDAIAKWTNAKTIRLTIENSPLQEIVERIGKLSKTMKIAISYVK